MQKKAKDEAYRNYVADALKVIVENTAKAVSEGTILTMRYQDLINNEEPEERTEEQIIDGIKTKLRKMK